MEIKDLVKQAHENAVKHGWWEKPKSPGELLVLIHSEVSEALEEIRNGHQMNETYYSGKITSDEILCYKTIIIEGKSKSKFGLKEGSLPFIEINKPEGVPSELADIVIRVFDMCGYYGIDLYAAIKEKMAYNESRPYKHGGKKL